MGLQPCSWAAEWREEAPAVGPGGFRPGDEEAKPAWENSGNLRFSRAEAETGTCLPRTGECGEGSLEKEKSRESRRSCLRTAVAN